MAAKNAGVQIIDEATENPVASLIAVHPILYLAHQYAVGEELPTSNKAMVEAWISAGTAVWRNGDPAPAPKAKPATAEPGLPGQAVASESEDGEDLVGKVPKTTTRKKK